MTIYYLKHLGESQTDPLKEFLEDEWGVVSVGYTPENFPDAMATVNELARVKPSLLIGRGLGGFYALKALETRDIYTMVINPMLVPSIHLMKAISTGYRDSDTNKLVPLPRERYEEFADLNPDYLRTRVTMVKAFTAIEAGRVVPIKLIGEYLHSVGIPCDNRKDETIYSRSFMDRLGETLRHYQPRNKS